jgi:hypothetical protein
MFDLPSPISRRADNGLVTLNFNLNSNSVKPSGRETGAGMMVPVIEIKGTLLAGLAAGVTMVHRVTRQHPRDQGCKHQKFLLWRRVVAPLFGLIPVIFFGGICYGCYWLSANEPVVTEESYARIEALKDVCKGVL